jgi:hypothetical protein
MTLSGSSLAVVPATAVASFPWQHVVISFGVLLVVLLVAMVAARVYRLRHPDSRPRPADEQNPILRGLLQVGSWLVEILPF